MCERRERFVREHLGCWLGDLLAEVREVGASPDVGSTEGRHTQRGGGPTVNTLVIANNGDTPIYVLAGTVVTMS